MRRISPWWLLLPVLVVGSVIAVQTLRPKAAPTELVKPEVARAERSVFRLSISGPGTLEAIRSIEIKPSTGGKILQVVELGERVTRGQLIVRLDQTTAKRSLEDAELALAKARNQLKSAQASGVNTQNSREQSVAQARVTLDSAQRDVSTANTNLKSMQSLYAVGGTSAQSVADARDQLARAQSQHTQAQISYKTAQDALGLEATSTGQDLENLRLAVQQAEISRNNAQTDLANTKVYAPFSGVVSVVTANVGANIAAQTSVLTLLDDSSVKLPVQVDESEIAKVKLGQSAEVSFEALGDEVFTGKVTNISPQARISSNIAIFDVMLSIPNPTHKLRPGMSGEAEIIAQEIRGAILIPVRAVERVRTRAYVQVATDPAHPENAERRRVETGPDDGTNIVITSGLDGGEVIVLPTRERESTSQGSQTGQGQGQGNTNMRGPGGGGFGIPFGGGAGGR